MPETSNDARRDSPGDSPGAPPNSRDKRRLRRIAHHLNPIVTVAESGLTDNVCKETDRALDDHELIKVRISVDDRVARKALGAELATRCNGSLIQVIGKTFVMYRPNPKANPKLSNLSRFGSA